MNACPVMHVMRRVNVDWISRGTRWVYVRGLFSRAPLRLSGGRIVVKPVEEPLLQYQLESVGTFF